MVVLLLYIIGISGQYGNFSISASLVCAYGGLGIDIVEQRE
jgi:hypothetical protein